MQRYSREELLRASGARQDELADLEHRGLLLPNRARGPFGRGEPYYTASQLGVLRYLLRSRRAWEASRRIRPAPGARVEAGAQGPSSPDGAAGRGGKPPGRKGGGPPWREG